MGTDLVAVDEAARFLGNLSAVNVAMRGEPLERFVTPFELLPDFAKLRA